jgi:hypothetical protein
MKQRFYVNVISKEIKLAAEIAKKLLSDKSPMLNDLSMQKFAYNSGTGLEVYNKIVGCDKILPIFTYRPFNPFTLAVGYYDGKAIHINIRKLPSLDLKDLVGLLCHEYLHAVGFTHGNNYKTQNKILYSVPYYVSENIGLWL